MQYCSFCSEKDLGLVPKFLAIWGLTGYITILCGSMLEILGYDMHLIHTIPGGLWELFIGIWLIAKGFNSSPIVLKADKTDLGKS